MSILLKKCAVFACERTVSELRWALGHRTCPRHEDGRQSATGTGATPSREQIVAHDVRAKGLAHRHMDSSYSEPGYLSSKLGFPRHCRALTQAYETAAKGADTLAKAHRTMADEAAGEAK